MRAGLSRTPVEVPREKGISQSHNAMQKGIVPHGRAVMNTGQNFSQEKYQPPGRSAYGRPIVFSGRFAQGMGGQVQLHFRRGSPGPRLAEVVRGRGDSHSRGLWLDRDLARYRRDSPKAHRRECGQALSNVEVRICGRWRDSGAGPSCLGGFIENPKKSAEAFRDGPLQDRDIGIWTRAFCR